jgi:hypothetical protein
MTKDDETTYKKVKCEKGLTFEECELTILRSAVDLAQEKMGKKVVNSPEIQEMITILEEFLRRKGLVCYGGSALNEELPEEDRFYNKDAEIPDYDFYSPNALEDAKELADIYHSKGYEDVEAKSGQHHGTFKVYVNFIPIADITYMQKELFDAIKKDAIRINGILFSPPNLLRMGSFLELSRPAGDTSRWEKVMKRIALLNKHYPLTEIDCENIDFQRKMEHNNKAEEIYETVKETFINQGCVFFGGYALANYSKYMPKKEQEKVKKIADFDVLSNDPDVTAEIVKERLKDIGVNNVKIVKRAAIGEIIPEQTEIRVGKDIVAVIYPTIACHSYNTLKIDGRKVKIATIDTMLSFYLAFIYADKRYYDPNRILCMAKFLFDVQQKNRLEQKGLLRRFTITCYGHQQTVEEMRAEKAKKFRELKGKKGTREYEEWFLNYNPNPSERKNKTTKTRYIRQNKRKPKRKTMKKGKKGFFY